MKKAYETPSVEVVKFNYNDQVVVASGCGAIWVNTGTYTDGKCMNGEIEHRYTEDVG